MTETLCVRCGRPMADQAYVCQPEAQELSEALTVAAGHAEDAEAVIARQTRYGAGSRGGSSEPLPVDITKAAEYHRIAGEIGTWARVVTDHTGRGPRWRALAGPLCPPTGHRCTHGSCEAIRRRTPPPPLARECAWLSTQTGWLRTHPAADEAFRALHDACDDLARLVDRPADKALVGVCDCGRVLYAPRGRAVIQCPDPTCRLVWNVAQSRDILRRALGDKLVTVAEAARLGAYLDSRRTQDTIRKLLASRIASGQLVAHGQVAGESDDGAAGDREPVYVFAEAAAVLASIPVRTREQAA